MNLIYHQTYLCVERAKIPSKNGICMLVQNHPVNPMRIDSRNKRVFCKRRIPHSMRRSTPSATSGNSTSFQEVPTQSEDTTTTSTCKSTSTYLKEIHIENFALVAKQSIQLHNGFNVISGESGSGKSVLISALGQLLGSPTLEDAVRPPAKTATIEGIFSIAPHHQLPIQELLSSLGIPLRSLQSVDTITIRREINSTPSGNRSKCSINGASASLKILREIGRLLVDVNGQHASISLKNDSMQLALIDQASSLSPIVADLSSSWKQLQTLRSSVAALNELADEEERASLQLLVDTVAVERIEPGEDIAIKQRLKQLDSRREAAERCRLIAIGIGGGDGGILDALHVVDGHLQAIGRQEERFQEFESDNDGLSNTEGGELDIDIDDEVEVGEAGSNHRNRNAAKLLVDEAGSSLSAARAALHAMQDSLAQYSRVYRFSQQDYDDLGSRLQELKKLCKNFDVNCVDELLEKSQIANSKLDSYYLMEGKKDELDAELVRLEDLVRNKAIDVSKRRKEAALRVKGAIESVLKELSMGNCRFDIELTWTRCTLKMMNNNNTTVEIPPNNNNNNNNNTDNDADQHHGVFLMQPHGLDTASFLFAAGPEEPLLPLSAVASGGEAARLMLAIKASPSYMKARQETESAFSKNDTGIYSSSGLVSSPVVVFDEIDSGVGSRLGHPIGRILRGMASPMQVVCVSHLPQVAAHGQYHICVRKETDNDGRIVSRFIPLMTYEERLEEVAAMLGLNLNAAEELMKEAQNVHSPNK